jgi:hypothetical protein
MPYPLSSNLILAKGKIEIEQRAEKNLKITFSRDQRLKIHDFVDTGLTQKTRKQRRSTKSEKIKSIFH